MSEDAAFSAARQRDSERLHQALAGMSDDELRKLSDTGTLLRAAAEVVLAVRREPAPMRPVRPPQGDCPYCGADDAQWCRRTCPAIDRGDGR